MKTKFCSKTHFQLLSEFPKKKIHRSHLRRTFSCAHRKRQNCSLLESQFNLFPELTSQAWEWAELELVHQNAWEIHKGMVAPATCWIIASPSAWCTLESDIFFKGLAPGCNREREMETCGSNLSATFPSRWYAQPHAFDKFHLICCLLKLLLRSQMHTIILLHLCTVCY